MRINFLLYMTFSHFLCFSQKIDNTASFREITSEKYFRINYENDLFAFQDANYTQGFSFELVESMFKKNPVNKLFFHFENDAEKFGIALEHICFTPDDYTQTEIQKGDRPFASSVMLKSFKIATNKVKKHRFTSQLTVGMMGPLAQGEEIQTGIHRLTQSAIPMGWRNQINNHFVLNYGVDYEKSILTNNDFVGFNLNASVKLGNLFTNTTLGFNTVIGFINRPYHQTQPKKIVFYGYFQPTLSAIVYDGSLQGELFGNRSVYTISQNQIQRIVGQINFGLVLQTKFLYFEYSRSSISSEIKTLSKASWGGIKVGFSF